MKEYISAFLYVEKRYYYDLDEWFRKEGTSHYSEEEIAELMTVVIEDLLKMDSAYFDTEAKYGDQSFIWGLIFLATLLPESVRNSIAPPYKSLSYMKENELEDSLAPIEMSDDTLVITIFEEAYNFLKNQPKPVELPASSRCVSDFIKWGEDLDWGGLNLFEEAFYDENADKDDYYRIFI